MSELNFGNTPERRGIKCQWSGIERLECNGIEPQALEWNANGVEWNGMEWNGVKRKCMERRGTE